MPQFKVEGLGELSADLGELATLPDDVLDNMLNAEADIVEPAIKAKALAYGVNDTGKLIGAIKRGKARRSANGRALSISPQGSRTRNGVTTRNSEIAFLNEYGKRNVPARPFMRDATEESADETVQAAAKVYDDYLKSKKF